MVSEKDAGGLIIPAHVCLPILQTFVGEVILFKDSASIFGALSWVAGGGLVH